MVADVSRKANSEATGVRAYLVDFAAHVGVTSHHNDCGLRGYPPAVWEPRVSTRWVSMRLLKQSPGATSVGRAASDHSRKPRERGSERTHEHHCRLRSLYFL